MSDVNRRDALKALGLLPLAGAFGTTPDQMERVAALMQGLPEGHASSAAPTKFFTAHELQTVRILVDDIIPRDARSGSATDAKVPEFMDFILADADTPSDARTAMRGGLAWLDGECQRRHGKSFARSTEAQRKNVLDDIAWPAKARPEMSHGVAFFNRVRDLTASGFFSSAIGYRDLDFQGNVFNPGWDGCPEAALTKLGVSYDLMDRRKPA
ncbi:MAG: gluconate 2-dehydrogenase subunit 3 family protein [Gemmatimonadaceae bacterium]